MTPPATGSKSLGAGWRALEPGNHPAYSDAKYAHLRGAMAPEALGRVTAKLYLFPGVSSAASASAISAFASGIAAMTSGEFVAAEFVASGILGAVLPGRRGFLGFLQDSEMYGLVVSRVESHGCRGRQKVVWLDVDVYEIFPAVYSHLQPKCRPDLLPLFVPPRKRALG